MVDSTEVVPEREQADRSIREALTEQLSGNSADTTEHNEAAIEVEQEEQESEAISEEATETTSEQSFTPLAPPADMNAVEKEAFLNPTPENSHVIQSYLNRRAYETRSQYDKKMQEVNQLRNNLTSLNDTLSQYEDEYAKQGYTIADVTKRSIAWDRAMQNNPVATAREWLESYGLTVDDLLDEEMAGPQQPEQPQQNNYLTREEAERIADERLQSMQDEQQKKAIEYYNQQVVNSFTANKPLFKDPETAAQLEAEMAPVVQALTSTGKYSSAEEILETAYNYVVNGNPTFSSLMSKMAAQSAMEKEQAKVAKAKAASKSITGSAGSGTPRIESKDIRDNLRRRMAG
jgi:antitoxin component HigA of HigAB toxin-antitoxin module